MRHVPFFRWVLTLGVILIGCSAGLYAAVPDFPELRQVDLIVLSEEPGGACTVRWSDPFEHREREEPYLCDAERDPLLKAPNYDVASGFGWESGFVVAEGTDKGELYSLEEDSEAADERVGLSDTLVLFGLLLTIVGLVGGNIRAMFRVGGVKPQVVRRARRLSLAASLVVQDHARAVEAVRQAWAPLHRERVEEELRRMPVARLRRAVGWRLRAGALERNGVRTVRAVLDAGVWELGQLPGVGLSTAEKAVAAARGIAAEASEAVSVRVEADRPEPRTTALLVALRVLVEAGPRARIAAQAGRELTARLEPLLAEATAASGYKQMLGAGPEQRRLARAAVGRLRLLLEEAERDGVAQQFRQASVDLLRGPDNDAAGLGAWVDFDTRPAEYYGLLGEVTGRSPSSVH